MAGQNSERGRASGLEGNRRLAIGAAVGIAGEAAAVLAAFSSDAGIATVLLLHAMCVAGVAMVLFGQRQKGREARDDALPAAILLAIAVAGPAGAVAALSALPFHGSLGNGPETLKEWYQRLAAAGRVPPPQELDQRIASGRVLKVDAGIPENYLRVITSGTLDERQRALGLIARQFHPDYAPVLQAALRSPEPVIRVQASAVVARVREDLKARIAILAKESTSLDAEHALKNAGELQSLQRCALLDNAQQMHCRELLKRRLAGLLERGQDVLSAAIRADASARAAIERTLIAEQRYKELRVIRRVLPAVAKFSRRFRRIELGRA